MINNYEEYISQVIRVLFVIVGGMVVFMISSFLTILSVRNCFRSIYMSFLNVTEGEFEDRANQLNKIGDILAKFKQQNYFGDIMGKLSLERPVNNSNKTNKRFVGVFYCFGILMSIVFLFLFYLIQITISGVMLLQVEQNKKSGISTCVKQGTMVNLINNQLYLRNALLQKIILGSDT